MWWKPFSTGHGKNPFTTGDTWFHGYGKNPFTTGNTWFHGYGKNPFTTGDTEFHGVRQKTLLPRGTRSFMGYGKPL